MRKIRVLSYLPHYIKPYGIGYAAHNIAVGMNNESIFSSIFSLRTDLTESKYVLQAIDNNLIYKIITKLVDEKYLIKYAEYKFKKIIQNYDVAILWPGCSLETFQYLKKIGKMIIIENINCHHVTSIRILNNEVDILGLSDSERIPRRKLIDENAKLSLADYVFSPSPQVTKSLIEADIDTSKIIETSYGLEQNQLFQSDSKLIANGGFTAIFVGSVIFRKGIHLLLEYWHAAKINGTLKVIGKIDPSMDTIIKKYENDLSIEFIPFTTDLASYYKSADVFVMPSLEEGSPLVTYLAIGASLPCIVSPMAGEGVIRNGIEGYIIEPKEKQEWIAAIRQLATNKSLRDKFALASRLRAEQFIWPLVAQRRANEILKRM